MPQVERIDDYRWRIPRQGGMRTEGLIFADDQLMRDLEGDQAVQQVANVAHLPGIVGPAIAMPDIHWGYGFPIGGVAAFDEAEGVVSPGGVGYDINCGVRLLATPLTLGEARPRLRQLVDALYATIPSGLGASRSDVRLARGDLDEVLRLGARWAVEQGYGDPADLEAIEGNGTLPDADPDCVSDRAKERGKSQLGTVGSGNHFVEVGYVAERYDERVADRLGLGAATVTVFIHSGSRGLGYQVCDDHLDLMLRAAAKYGIAPRFPAQAPRAGTPIPGHWAARADSRRHGALLLRVGRHGRRVHGDVRLELPRRWAPPQPTQGEAARAAAQHPDGARGAGDPDPRRDPRDRGRGDARGLQGRGAGRGRGGPGGDREEGGAAQARGGGEGLENDEAPGTAR